MIAAVKVIVKRYVKIFSTRCRLLFDIVWTQVKPIIMKILINKWCTKNTGKYILICYIVSLRQIKSRPVITVSHKLLWEIDKLKCSSSLSTPNGPTRLTLVKFAYLRCLSICTETTTAFAEHPMLERCDDVTDWLNLLISLEEILE